MINQGPGSGVTCWGERACPMFWATSVDWSQQMKEPRDRTWKDCRNEIPIAQLQPRTHNTRTIFDEELCIWGKNGKVKKIRENYPGIKRFYKFVHRTFDL